MMNKMYGQQGMGPEMADAVLRNADRRTQSSIPRRDSRLQPDPELSQEEVMRAADALLPVIGEALTGYGIDEQIPNIAQNLARQLVLGQGSRGLPTGNMSQSRMSSMGPSARMAQRGYNAP